MPSPYATGTATEMLRSARSGLLSTRRMIAEAAGERSAAQLDSLVMTLAQDEGRVYLLTTVAQVMDQDGDLAERRAMAVGFIYSTLYQGADDGWSGDRNEWRRAHFEGVRRAARDLHYGVLGLS